MITWVSTRLPPTMAARMAVVIGSNALMIKAGAGVAKAIDALVVRVATM